MQYTSESTIEHLKTHDKVESWINGNNLEVSLLNKECNSICSMSITDDKMLDYVVHGHNTNNKNRVSLHDTGYSDNYNTDVMTKNDIGYYSDSNESTMHEKGPYITENATFHNIAQKASVPVQEHSPHAHVDKAMKEETLAQSPPLQTTVTSPVPSGYITLENQFQSHAQNIIEVENKNQGDCFHDATTSNQYAASPANILVKETNETPSVLEEDSFPYTTAEIQPTSLPSPVSVEGKNGNGNSPAVSKLIENNHVASQSCSTEINSAVSMEITKQGTPITDSFPYVALNENNHISPPSQHTCALTGKKII